MRTWCLVVVALVGAATLSLGVPSTVSFDAVTSDPGGRYDYMLAVADMNGDGLDDLVVGGYEGYNIGEAPVERWTRSPIGIFLNRGDGTFTPAPEMLEGPVEARHPFVIADDFNSDGKMDLAVFDAGVYVYDASRGYGNPPQLLLSGVDGVLRPSSALADAVRAEHEANPPLEGVSGPADLHLKAADSGDIDNDGDIDIFVESGGGVNVEEHFMVNNGDGTFTVELRTTRAVIFNFPPGYWGYHATHFFDADNDGDLDLALGTIRDGALTALDSHSIVMMNDGSGYYPTRIELPYPDFHDGFTAIEGIASFDVNEDGFLDLIYPHMRNNDTPLDTVGHTGRYIQILINAGGTAFIDETPTWMADQSATLPERDADGNDLSNIAQPQMHDVDGDGCLDLTMAHMLVRPSKAAPLVYWNNGSGQFQAMDPGPFAGISFYAMPADLDNDGLVDFVVSERDDGPDGKPRTEDDFSTFVAHLNTTAPGPTRCETWVTAVGRLPDRTLYLGAVAVAAVVPVGGAFQEARAYRAASSAPGVVAVRVSGSTVTVTSVAEGVATITVTATGADNSTATQRFAVTVVASTPPRAVQFLELRRRIEMLRARERRR